MGGGTNSYREIEETDVILLWGSNARETHPIFFHHLLKGIHNGARLIAVDPRRTSSVRWADTWAGLDVGTDIVVANAMGREIIAQGWHNRWFIDHATTGFDSYRQAVEPFTLAEAERLSGVHVSDTRTRWGSCSADGSIRLHWKLTRAPTEVLHYVALHEAAHLLELNHSARYWAHVTRLMPGWPAHRAWLKEYGHTL